MMRFRAKFGGVAAAIVAVSAVAIAAPVEDGAREAEQDAKPSGEFVLQESAAGIADARSTPRDGDDAVTIDGEPFRATVADDDESAASVYDEILREATSDASFYAAGQDTATAVEVAAAQQTLKAATFAIPVVGAVFCGALVATGLLRRRRIRREVGLPSVS